MEFLNSLRAFLDPKFLLEEFINLGIGYAILGLVIGITTAFILWYRSTRRIQALADENASLSKGDINVRGSDRDFDVEEERIAASTDQVVEQEPEEEKLDLGVATTVAAAGAAVAGAATILNRDDDDEQEEDFHVETTEAPAVDTDYRLATAYDHEPADADDLTLLEGIDEERAAELREAGIYKFSQLEGLDEEERRKFGFKFGWPDINWGAWGATAAAAGVGGAALLNRGSSEVETDPVVFEEEVTVVADDDFQLTTTFDSEPTEIDDLTLIDGIDADKAAEMRRAGIYKFSQLEELDDQQREKFGKKFNWAGWGALAGVGALGAGLIREGEDEEEVQEEASFGLLDEAQPEDDFQLRTVYDEEPADADDLTQLEGIDAEKAAELRQAGIYKISQLEELDDDEREKLGRKFNFPDLNWGKWGALGALGAGALGAGLLKEGEDEVEEETSFGLLDEGEPEDNFQLRTVYDEEPADADDLTQLEGIDAEKAEELRQAGIYKISQLEELDDDEREKLGRKFNFPDINWGKWGALGALGAGALGAGLLKEGDDEEEEASFGLLDEGEPEEDFQLKTVYAEEPEDADDLTLLEGIDAEKAEELRAAGIYKVSQLEELDDDEREKLGRKFNFPDISWGKWGTLGALGAGALGAGLLKEGEDEEEPETSFGLLDEGEDEDGFDFQLKTIYDEEPADADDLTQLEGIDDEKAAELRQAGIYKISQLEELDDDEREKLGRKFKFPDLNWGKWGTLGALGAGAIGASLLKEGENEDENETSFGLLDEGESEAENDFQLKTVYDEEPVDADDLTQLEGIDAEKAEELRAAGIYKISQLEELDDDEREKLGRKFKFPDISWGKWGTLGALGAGALGAGLLKEGEDENDADFQLNTANDEEATDADNLNQLQWGDGFGTDAAVTVASDDDVDLNLGTVFTEAPEDADDLTLLEGIDEEKAAALHEAGIYKFSQLEELDEEQRDKFGKKFNWPDLNWGKWGAIGALGTVAGASLLKAGDDESESAAVVAENVSLSTDTQKIQLPEGGNADVKPDWTWGYTFSEKPDQADDLTQLDGITEEDAARLNAEGVYTIKQLEELPEEKRDEVKSRFGWGDIDWAKWGGAGVAGTAVAAAGVSALARDTDEETVSAELPNEVADRSDVQSDWTWGYTFKDKPADADDLTQMEGVTAEQAEELNSQGVYTFKQLQNLPEDKREEVKAKFGWGSIDWGKWGTIGAFGTAAAAAGVTLAGSDDDDDSGEVQISDPELEAPKADVSSVWETESEKISSRTVAVDTTAKYGELSLSTDDFATSISEDFSGESVDVHPRYGIIYPAQPGQIDDLTRVRGIGLATEKQLNHNGIYRFKQIANWNAGAVEGISNDMDLGTRVRDDEWVSQARAFVGDEADVAEEHSADQTDYSSLISEKYSGQNVDFKPGLGVLYTEAPANPDDLTEINGIGDSLQGKLNEYGVYKFTQLADWNDNNVTAFNDRLSFSGRIERDEWVPQAQKFAQREADEAGYIPDTSDIPLPDIATYDSTVSKFSGQDVDVDPQVGVIYKNRPAQSDDLKQIWGIGNRIEKDLNSNGIYRFAQIADWNDYNVRQFDERLDLKGRIGRDQWISQAQSLADESGELQSRYGSIVSSQFAGESVTVKPRYGVVYSQPPATIDDLTEINGIGPVTENQLNDLGIYTFKQVANFDNDAIEAVEESIDGPGRVTRNQWITQAKDFIEADISEIVEEEPERPETMAYLETLGSFDGENVDIDENFGVIYTGRPTEQDDLKRIRGVGKYLEKELNDRGVYRFKQIAAWNPYNIWAFGKDLAFPGRVTRENWVGQSKELAELDDYRIEAEKLVKSDYEGKGVKVDPELGIVYRKKPDVVDDLTQLDGIDQETAARLNSDGIYTIDQVNKLKGPQQKSFASRFGLGDIDWGKWGGISALGAIGAVGAGAIATAKEAGADAVEAVTEKATDVIDTVTEGDLPSDEPKGIFGTGEDDDTSATRRVAFIMDVSRSLTPAQLRLSKTELSAAVSSLPEGSLYQVIFFSGPTWFAHQRMTEGGARGEDVVISDGDEQINWKSGFGGFEYDGGNESLPGSTWREVTPENIESTLEDIEAVGKSYGTTWHLPLTMAMNLEPVPKNIYFLTDGETARQDQVAQEMIDMAQSRGGITKINTIALMVPGASVPLHRMALGTGGEYSLVIAGGKVLKDDDLREYLSEKDISLDD